MKSVWLKLCISLAVGAIIGSGIASAQEYPLKSVRFIVPFPPGGATDAFARILGQKLNESLGQQFVVDNRAGAGGNIATEIAAKSPADGYTIIVVGPNHAVNVSLYPKLGFDPVADFTPVTQVASVQTFLVVHPSLPVHSVKELVALAKAKPGQLNYGSGGNGAPGHLAGEMLKMLTGIQMVHVPYKGVGSIIGLVRGDHSVEFNNLISVGAQIKEGKVRVLAVGDSKRTPFMPNVPTVAEAGVPGFEMVQWFGVLAPAATPRPVIAKLHGEMVKALRLADVNERFHNLGAEPVGNTPEQFGALIRSEVVKWARVVKQAGIHID
jgi:tripartite-type tricarboxylate transporter receptor subunit TctC